VLFRSDKRQVRKAGVESVRVEKCGKSAEKAR